MVKLLNLAAVICCSYSIGNGSKGFGGFTLDAALFAGNLFFVIKDLLEKR